MSGAQSYHAGAAAEDQVEAHYLARGYSLAARRWRGQAGEVDRIFRRGPLVVFVEVKSSKSHDRAVAQLSPAQQARIMGAAAEFVGSEPAGQDTDMRFDVALVDQAGVIKILENALGP